MIRKYRSKIDLMCLIGGWGVFGCGLLEVIDHRKTLVLLVWIAGPDASMRFLHAALLSDTVFCLCAGKSDVIQNDLISASLCEYARHCA
jgi:hypothetical protein